MATRRDRESSQNEKYLCILADLLKDEHNKHCMDCDGKGPRWASWNLGIFLCIRCAGIHRKLGVHISKVKSVNLDTWTPQQICMMQDIGNEVGRNVYEAHLPDNFRRPQTDSPLEQFMRAKYEEKRYIDRSWQPPKQRTDVILTPKPGKQVTSPTRQSAGDAEEKAQGRVGPLRAPGQNRSVAALQSTLPHTQSSPTVDLLGLEMDNNTVASSLSVPTAQHTAKTSSADDLFGDFVSSESTAASVSSPTKNADSSLPADLFGLQFGHSSPASEEEKQLKSISGDQKPAKSTKESILALYGQAPPQAPPQQIQGQLGNGPPQFNTGGGAGWSDNFQSFQSGGNSTGGAFGIEHNPFFGGAQPQQQAQKQSAGINQENYLQQIQSKLSGLQMSSGSNVMQGPSGWDQLNTPTMAATSSHTMSANLWQ